MSGTPKIKAKMVHISSSVENMSRHELINWVNGMLYANLLKIEEMSNGKKNKFNYSCKETI